MSEEILNVKLISGEEVIAFVEENGDGMVTLTNPSLCVFNNGEYDLAPFSPFSYFEDMKFRVFTISENNIMFASEPSKGLLGLFNMYFNGTDEPTQPEKQSNILGANGQAINSDNKKIITPLPNSLNLKG